MATEIDFLNSEICVEKIKEILKNSENGDGRVAFRAIKHKSDVNLKKEDFYPSIMERNGFVMPCKERQLNKTIGSFGVSVCDTFDNVYKLIQAIPALRNVTKCFAVGLIDANKGTVGKIDDQGHYQYFLFEPKNESKNPYVDFNYYKESEQNE